MRRFLDERFGPFLFTKGVDMVWCAQAFTAVQAVMHDKWEAAGIPVITIDNGMPGAIFFGANNWEAGKKCGKWLADYATQNWGGVVDGVAPSWLFRSSM